MLITSLLPLLARYSLGFDLISSGDAMVTLTVIPRKTEWGKSNLEPGEVRPISITATAAEIDAELALGMDGALHQLFIARKELGDQLAEQREAAATAKSAATSKAKPVAAKAGTKPEPEPAPTPAPVPADPETKPGEPVSLW